MGIGIIQSRPKIKLLDYVILLQPLSELADIPGQPVGLVETPAQDANLDRCAKQPVQQCRRSGQEGLAAPAIRPDQQVLLLKKTGLDIVQRGVVMGTERRVGKGDSQQFFDGPVKPPSAFRFTPRIW